MTGRKTVTTTHGRYTVDGSMSEKTIKMMMAPYERLISIHDAETGEEITGRENAEEESGDALLLIADYEHVEPRGEESPVATVRVAELRGTVPVDDRLYETSVVVGDRPALRSVAESAVYYAGQRGIRRVVVANRDVWEVFESGEIDTTGLEVVRRSQPPPPAERGDNILIADFDRHHTLGDEFVAAVRIVERRGYMPTDGGYRETVVVQGDREKLRQAVRRGLDYARQHGLRVCVNNRHVREDIKAGILDAGGLEVTYGGGAVR